MRTVHWSAAGAASVNAGGHREPIRSVGEAWQVGKGVPLDLFSRQGGRVRGPGQVYLRTFPLLNLQPPPYLDFSLYLRLGVRWRMSPSKRKQQTADLLTSLLLLLLQMRCRTCSCRGCQDREPSTAMPSTLP